MSRSYVVTGGGRGVGRALVERLLGDEDTVVAIELDPAALAWTERYPRAIAAMPPTSPSRSVLSTSPRPPPRSRAGSTTLPCSGTPRFALAVEYGSRGIRVNAVALGTIATERYEGFLGHQEPAAAQRIEEEMRLLHPVGRVGRPTRSRPPWLTCSPTRRASSPARPCPSTAAGRCSRAIRRRAT
jgi:NAD(P)-dependent dehydrogenase (short-subunit alcohol dehydrogenase family)